MALNLDTQRDVDNIIEIIRRYDLNDVLDVANLKDELWDFICSDPEEIEDLQREIRDLRDDIESLKDSSFKDRSTISRLDQENTDFQKKLAKVKRTLELIYEEGDLRSSSVAGHALDNL